jgi:hypothetical protein
MEHAKDSLGGNEWGTGEDISKDGGKTSGFVELL